MTYDTTIIWLLLTIACIAIQAFFPMMEMASISFNTIHLQYSISRGDKKAIMLNFLLQNPARLFGTTLIGVNVALQVGSECSRMLYSSMGLNPNFSPITQVILVLIFAELAPMFAARRYSEHVAMSGIRILHAASKVLVPVTWAINILSRVVGRLFGAESANTTIFLTRDELQKTIEELKEPSHPDDDKEDFNAIAANIFNLRNTTAQKIMVPLSEVQMLPDHYTVGRMRILLNKAYYPYLPIFEGFRENVIGIAYPHDLIVVDDSSDVKSHVKPPWFISGDANIQHILHEFRTNGKNIAIVLDGDGSAIGILTLQDILDEIFGEMSVPLSPREKYLRVIDKTLPGTMKVTEFNDAFDADLDVSEAETLADLMKNILGHEPERSESVKVDQFEFTAEDSTLLGVQTISVKTIN